MAGDTAQEDVESLSEDVFRNRLVELPPSVKLVVKVLEAEAPLTQQEITHETLLPERTVRYAISRLEDEDLVNSKPGIRDTRRLYTLRTTRNTQ